MTIKRRISKLFFTSSQRRDFYQLCADYLGEGQSISRLVSRYRRRYEEDGNFLAGVFEQLEYSLNSGANFSDAFKGLIPIDELSMIATVDRNDTEDVMSVFRILVNVLDKKIAMQKVMFGFRVLILAVVGLVAPLVLKLLSSIQMESMSRVMRYVNIYELDAYNRWVIESMQPWLNSYFYFLYFIISVIISATYLMVVHIPPNKARMVIEKSGWFFPFYLYSRFKSFMFLMTAGAFSEAGYSINDYVRMMSRLSKNYEQKIYGTISSRLASGQFSDGKAMMIGWLSKDIEYRIEDYSESAEFGKAAVRLAEQTFESVKASINRILTIVLYVSATLVFLSIASLTLSNQLLLRTI